MYNARMKLAGFAVDNEAVVSEKINRFVGTGPDKLHVLFDFDRTLTVGNQGDDDATTWQVLQRH